MHLQMISTIDGSSKKLAFKENRSYLGLFALGVIVLISALVKLGQAAAILVAQDL